MALHAALQTVVALLAMVQVHNHASPHECCQSISQSQERTQQSAVKHVQRLHSALNVAENRKDSVPWLQMQHSSKDPKGEGPSYECLHAHRRGMKGMSLEGEQCHF